ncbi:hypothetical protein T439DRAFT_34697 [Meredithblackwellia eburnea MCA 4105]
MVLTLSNWEALRHLCLFHNSQHFYDFFDEGAPAPEPFCLPLPLTLTELGVHGMPYYAVDSVTLSLEKLSNLKALSITHGPTHSPPPHAPKFRIMAESKKFRTLRSISLIVYQWSKDDFSFPVGVTEHSGSVRYCYSHKLSKFTKLETLHLWRTEKQDLSDVIVAAAPDSLHTLTYIAEVWSLDKLKFPSSLKRAEIFSLDPRGSFSDHTLGRSCGPTFKDSHQLQHLMIPALPHDRFQLSETMLEGLRSLELWYKITESGSEEKKELFDDWVVELSDLLNRFKNVATVTVWVEMPWGDNWELDKAITYRTVTFLKSKLTHLRLNPGTYVDVIPTLHDAEAFQTERFGCLTPS